MKYKDIVPLEIRIVPYDRKYLEQHVEIGSQVSKDWKGFGQTSLDVMEKQYARSDFDANTRLYAIDSTDNLVGFMTGTILEEGMRVGKIEFPFVKRDDEKLAEELYETMLKQLRQEGCDKLRTRVSRHWGDREEWAKKYGFSKTHDIYHQVTVSPKHITVEEKPVSSFQLIPFDYTNHRNRAIQLMNKHLETSDELAGSYLDGMQDWENDGGGISHLSIMYEGLVVGRLVMYVNETESDKKLGGSLVFEVKQDRNLLVETALYLIKAFSSKHNLTEGDFFIGGITQEELDEWKGVIVSHFVLSYYEKTLEL